MLYQGNAGRFATSVKDANQEGGGPGSKSLFGGNFGFWTNLVENWWKIAVGTNISSAEK